MRLLTLPFELQSVTAGIEFDSSNGAGAKSISTSVKRSGLASLRVNPSSSYWFLGHQYRSNSATGKVFARLFLYIGTLPGSAVSIFAFTASTTGGNSGAQLRLNSDGTLQLGYYNGSWNSVGSPSVVLARGVWHMIEISYDDSNANNTIAAQLNGIQFATGNGNNLGGNGCIQLGDIFDSVTMDINFDDVAVNDDTTSDQNSWPGNGRVIRLKPNAAGDANTFATQTGGTAGASNNHTRLSETTPDDATTYNGSSTLNEHDLFNVEDSGINSDDIVTLVHVGGRFRNSTADNTAALKFEILKASGGTITQSSAIVPNSTTWKSNAIAAPNNFPLTLYKDPDNNAWTKTTLDSMQIGYKLTTAPGTSGRRIDVSSVYALVEYAPAKVEKINDDFDDNSIDTAKWNTYTANSGSVAEANTQLEETLANNTNGSWAGIYSKNFFDLTGSSIFTQIKNAQTGHSWLDLTLSCEGLPIVDNFIAIGVDIGNQKLQAVKEIEGADTVLVEISYDPAVHKWIRLREAGGTVYWEWSTDGADWTTLYSSAAPIPIQLLYVVMDDYEYDGLAVSATHKLDNLNIFPLKKISGIARSSVKKISSVTASTAKRISRVLNA